MNQTNPNIISNDAVLVISASTELTGGQHINLINKIIQHNAQNPLPFYIVRRKKNILFHTTKQVRSQVNDIVQMLQYFSNLLMIKKLTVISFEEGSLLTLRALALAKYELFQIIDMLFLINPFNPVLPIFLGTPYTFIQDTKQIIIRDQSRLSMFNSTKIVMINTLDNNVGDNKKINWLFPLSNNQQIRLANTVVLSSKFMWNVYSYLKVSEYFKFQPFLTIVAKCFREARQNADITAKDLEYFLMYKESVIPKQLSMMNRRKFITKCVDYYIQNYRYDGSIFKGQCYRILRKQNAFFNANTTYLMTSKNKYEIYGQNYEKIMPYHVKSDEVIYLIENVLSFKRFFIINKGKTQITLTIQSSTSPKGLLPDGMEMDQLLRNRYENRLIIQNFTRKQIIHLCPGSSLLFPHHFGPRNNWDKHLYLEKIENQDSICYKATDFLMFWLEQIIENWPIGYNIGIFTLYCTHILQKSTFSRFYTQLLINCCLVFFAIGSFLPAQNFLLLSIIIVIELIFKFWIWTAELINAPKQLIAKMLWIPVIFEIAQQIHPNTYPSPWKILGVQFYALLSKNNVVILFLQILFVWKYLDQDEMNVSGLTMICAWLLVTTIEEAQKKVDEQSVSTTYNSQLIRRTGKKIRLLKEAIKKFRNELVNSITICIVALCVEEDGIILHYVTDFYVIIFVLFALHKLFNDDTS